MKNPNIITVNTLSDHNIIVIPKNTNLTVSLRKLDIYRLHSFHLQNGSNDGHDTNKYITNIKL